MNAKQLSLLEDKLDKAYGLMVEKCSTVADLEDLHNQIEIARDNLIGRIDEVAEKLGRLYEESGG